MTAPAIDLLDEYRRSQRSGGGVSGGGDFLDEYSKLQTGAPPLRMAPVVVRPPAPAPDETLEDRLAKDLGSQLRPHSEYLEHPVRTLGRLAAGAVVAPLESGFTLGKYAGQQVRQLQGRAPVEHPVSGKDAALAGAQLGTLALAGPAEEAIGPAAAPLVGSRAAGILARTAPAAAVGAAYNPEHPLLGAAVGGVLGAGLNELNPSRPHVFGYVTDDAGRMLPAEATPRAAQATGRVLETAPPPSGPDFEVEDSPLLREYREQQQASQAPTRPAAVTETAEAPSVEPEPVAATAATPAPADDLLNEYQQSELGQRDRVNAATEDAARRAQFPMTVTNLLDHAEAKGTSIAQSAETLRRAGYSIPPELEREAVKQQMRAQPSAEPTYEPPEKTDLFGNAVAPTVEQGSLLSEGAGTAQSRIDQQQLARKDQAISPEEMQQRRDELGAPKPADEQPKKAARRKPVEGAVNPKYRLDDNDALLDRAAELEARLEEYSSGAHGGPEYVSALDRNEVYDPKAMPSAIEQPHVAGTSVRHRLNQDADLYRGVMDELKARGVHPDTIDEGLAKRGRTPLAGSTVGEGDDTPFARAAPKARQPKASAAPSQPAPNAPASTAPASPPLEPPSGALHEIRGAIVPASVTPEAGHSARIVRAGLGEFAHNFEEARHQWKPLSKLFRKIGPQQSLDAYDRAERGAHTSAPADRALSVIQSKLRSVANEIHALGPGHLDNFIDNYLAHIYDDDTKARAVMQSLGRRPLEGGRSFQKQRTIPTLKEAMARGLKPKTWNPVDLNLLKLREMYKYLAAQKIVAEHKDVGLYKFVSALQKAPEGYDRINDHVAMVYGPPHVVIKEAFDSLIRQKLNDVIDGLPGLTHERAASLGRGKRGALGYASSSGDSMATKFAGPDGVIMHELGHILDFRYGLYAKLSAGAGAGELRALASLRHEGQPPDAKFEKYVQKQEEQTANAVHALLYAPEKMQQVAPTVKARLEAFLKSQPELAPLLDIKPSLVFDEAETTKSVGGLVLRGQYWAPKDVARILNNYLSPGLRGRSAVYDRIAEVGAMLNQAQLGLSGYHALFTSIDATVSQAAVALQNLVAGRLGVGARQLGSVAIGAAPFTNFLRGRQLLKAYLDTPNAPPAMKKYVEALIQGGGRVKMDDFYKSGAIQKMLDSFGEALQGPAAPASTSGRRLGQRATAGTKGAAYAVPALFELLAKPIMEVVVPAQKLGVFFNLAEHELATLPKVRTQDDERQAMQRAWQSVDNRLGQVVYDNLFWNRTGKDLAHLTIRSVGWNYGSIAEIGGGAVDIGRIINDAMHGRGPTFTPRAAYLIMLPIIVGLIDALIQYLRTKDAPGYKKGKWQGTGAMLKDLYYPRTGGVDTDGNDERESIPSYMKDVASYGMHTGGTLINKLHPELAMIAQMIQNKDFYGDEIHNPDDPMWKRRQQDLQYAKDQFIPLGVRNAVEAVRREGAFKGGVADYAKAVASNPKQLFGVNPAPREIERTPAQNKLQEYLARRGHTSETPEEKEQGQERRVTRAELLTLPRSEQRTEVREMIQSKAVTARQGTALLTRTGEHPLVSKFKQLTADEALKVWALADEHEKALWKKPLQIKMATAGRRADLPADARKAP